MAMLHSTLVSAASRASIFLLAFLLFFVHNRRGFGDARTNIFRYYFLSVHPHHTRAPQPVCHEGLLALISAVNTLAPACCLQVGHIRDGPCWTKDLSGQQSTRSLVTCCLGEFATFRTVDSSDPASNLGFDELGPTSHLMIDPD
jgi:hypothetical protein